MLSEKARVRPIAVVATAALCLALSGSNPPAAAAVQVGTAFTYQGDLQQGGVAVDEPVDGCDFEFRLFDAAVEGIQIGPTLTFDGVGGNPPPISVVDGRFTATLDFGVGIFVGDARFLEIGVGCPSGGAGLVENQTVLSPRQPITAAPEAAHALKATTLCPPATISTDDADNATLTVENNAPGAVALALNGGLEFPSPINDFIIGIDPTDASITGADPTTGEPIFRLGFLGAWAKGGLAAGPQANPTATIDGATVADSNGPRQ